jgi:hypothetical protein
VAAFQVFRRGRIWVFANIFTKEEVSEMQRAGAKRLCVYGTIKYRDAFEDSPTTEFCYHIIWSADRKKYFWIRNAKHNKAT